MSDWSLGQWHQRPDHLLCDALSSSLRCWVSSPGPPQLVLVEKRVLERHLLPVYFPPRPSEDWGHERSSGETRHHDKVTNLHCLKQIDESYLIIWNPTWPSLLLMLQNKTFTCTVNLFIHTSILQLHLLQNIWIKEITGGRKSWERPESIIREPNILTQRYRGCGGRERCWSQSSLGFLIRFSEKKKTTQKLSLFAHWIKTATATTVHNTLWQWTS